MSIYEPDSAERDWEREQRAEARFQREQHAPDRPTWPPTCNDASCSWCDPFGCIKPPEIRLIPPMQASLFSDELPERMQPVEVTRPKEARRG